MTLMASTIRIEQRFQGPPDSGNGGYTAGLIAVAVGETVNVRLHEPIPLDADLQIEPLGEDRWEVRREYDVVATAARTTLEIDVPPSVSFMEARSLSTHYAGFTHHSYRNCFVCGPARSERDGMRIFAGRLPNSNVVAAPWIPDTTLADADGKVRPEFIWAALDCPGFFARETLDDALLGEIAVHIERRVHIDEPCVVMGWLIRSERRKHFVGTALFDEDGERCALGRATWISVG